MMQGSNHIVVNTAASSAMVIGVVAITQQQLAAQHVPVVGTWLQQVVDTAWQWLVPVSGGWLVLYGVLSLGALILGSVAPDIDHPSSMLGRRSRWFAGWLQALPHRGVTHTDWFWLPLLAVSIFIPWCGWVFWAWFGAQLHNEFDGLSQGGRVRWYPLSRYRLYRLGGGRQAVGPDRYHRGVYSTGDRRETVLVATTVVCSTVLIGAAMTGMVML